MKINIAKSAGFCFGVKRAIELTSKVAAGKKSVQMLGDIVHNEEVVKQLEALGIKKVKTLTKGSNCTLIIRAHGAPLKIYKKAKELGYEIIDATCPMVREIHKIAQKIEKKGYQLIVIGNKKHDEVLGIMGNIKGKALVIEELQKIPYAQLRKIKKAGIVVQSTQDTEKVLKIVARLKQNIKTVLFFNTICQPTRKKQAEIKLMPKKNDLTIIIGSKTSANTKRLFEIAKSLNAETYWVQSEKDLCPGWFKGVKTVGVTAGASTPDTTTKKIIQQIKKLTHSLRSGLT